MYVRSYLVVRTSGLPLVLDIFKQFHNYGLHQVYTNHMSCCELYKVL